MTETLFSLEIHVESVENLRVACKLPALCFRLLDFPTMIIHHVSPVDAEKMRQRLRLEDKETLLHELKDRFGNFQFRKGKSCLFKASIDTLLVQLQTVPLYAMLMDLWPRKPALVGSTLIPLKKAIDKISTDVYKKGVAVPSFYRDEGEFNVYNLMGTCIAKVKLGFRLLSLGGSLIPHIPTEALAGKINKITTGGKVEQAVKGALEKVLPEIESRNLFEEEIAEENTESKTDGEKVTSPQRRDIKHNVQVQTNLHARDIKSPELLNHSRKESEDVVITNTFCPPPLYYNYFSNSAPCNGSNSGKMGEPVPQRSGNSNVTSNAHTVEREANRRDVDFMYYDPGLVQPDGTVGLASVSVQTDRTLPKPSVRLESSGDQAGLINGLYNLRGLTSDGRLPILNALFQELSCLTGGQQIMDTNQSSGRPQATPGHPPKASGKRLDSQATRKPLTAVKSRTRERQTQQAPPPKRTQSSVIGLSSRRVRFKQTNLTYGMTKTQKMRLELNQKDKLPNRTRPCEAQAVLAQKESIKRDSLRTPLSEGGLGMTYKIGSAKRQMGREMKQTADAQIQTQPSLSDHELEQLPCNNGGILPSTTDVKEEVAKPDDVYVHSAIESARSVQSPNSLEVFIPQVEGEPEEKSDQEGEWATDQPPTGAGFYGQTGIISSEQDERRAGSAMTMYTEDFEDSGSEGSQTSYHLAFTRSNSAENENMKQRSDHDDSLSAHSQASSVSSGRPIRSSRSPEKTKSRRLRNKFKVTETEEQKITEQGFDISADQVPPLEKSSPVVSKGHEEESEGSYTDDFHSAGSELENIPSDDPSVDSIDVDQRGMLDLPPAASNLGYTY